MKVKEPRFVTSAYSYEDYPQHNLPEFVFSGRSNVGKSSMINKLLNRKKLARISSQPGRTQSINFFNIDNRFFLVDLPGYGFAQVPKKVKDEWAVLIEDYLNSRPHITGIIQIVDARHSPTKDDIMMVNWLKETGLPTLVAATKVDKIKRSKRKKQKNLIKKKLQLNNEIQFCFFSSETGEGKNKVNRFILELL
ncbi:MAG: ribosome biogenesis GTP-binding protein YihA/YsxC [Halothermotrichaceae bacterium]